MRNRAHKNSNHLCSTSTAKKNANLQALFRSRADSVVLLVVLLQQPAPLDVLGLGDVGLQLGQLRQLELLHHLTWQKHSMNKAHDGCTRERKHYADRVENRHSKKASPQGREAKRFQQTTTKKRCQWTPHHSINSITVVSNSKHYNQKRGCSNLPPSRQTQLNKNTTTTARGKQNGVETSTSVFYSEATRRRATTINTSIQQINNKSANVDDGRAQLVQPNSSTHGTARHLPFRHDLHRGLAVGTLTVPAVRPTTPRQTLTLPLVLGHTDKSPPSPEPRNNDRPRGKEAHGSDTGQDMY